jgi:hypothetical protein
MLAFVLAAIRRNALAALALAVAVLGLAGGAYATFRLPANSVSTGQIVNHSITPAKLRFTQKTFGGYVRDWAVVSANGTIAAANTQAGNFAGGTPGGPVYAIAWSIGTSTQIIRNCVPEVTVEAPLAPGAQPGAYATAANDKDAIVVRTYNAAGVPTSEPFYLTVTC